MARISRGLLTLALTCLLAGLSARDGSAKVVDQIVAQVNDEVITMSELQRASRSIEAQEGISPKGKEDKASNAICWKPSLTGSWPRPRPNAGGSKSKIRN